MNLREAKQILESHNYILTEAKFSSFKDQIKKLVEHYKSRGIEVDVRNCTTEYTSYWFRKGYKDLDFDIQKLMGDLKDREGMEFLNDVMTKLG